MLVYVNENLLDFKVLDSICRDEPKLKLAIMHCYLVVVAMYVVMLNMIKHFTLSSS